MSQDVVREYAKTAERIALTPWKFTKASEYLMGWVIRNASKQPDRPEHLNFVLDGRNLNSLKQDEDVDLLPPGWLQFAPHPQDQWKSERLKLNERGRPFCASTQTYASAKRTNHSGWFPARVLFECF